MSVTAEEIVTYTDQDYSIESINYEHYDNWGPLTAISLSFANGEQTPIYEVEATGDEKYKREYAKEGRSRIKYISMNVWGNDWINGIRLIDESGAAVVDQLWNSNESYCGDWKGPYEIPDGQSIIGIAANTSKSSKIQRVGFILWNTPYS